jgi:hypothetical protein
MVRSRAYRSFAEFEREEIRPGMRIGWTVDELEETGSEQDLDFDADPFESSLWDTEADYYGSDEDDDDDEE